MVVVLIAEAFLSAFFEVLFNKMASHNVMDFIRSGKVNDMLLKNLKTAMESVIGVIDDAEEKQVTRPAVRKWLDDLKDAVYTADDFLDEIAYEFKLMEEAETFKDQLQNFPSFLNPYTIGLGEIEQKLKGLLKSLRHLVQQKDVLGLINRIGEKPSPQKTPTTSLVDELGVYGRDEEKEAIIELLLSDEANGKGLGVIPIMGMGGVGKTTLAQIVYNHSKIQEWFDLKAWIFVSEDFDLTRLTMEILEEVNSNSDFETLKEVSSKSGSKTLNQLQLQLKKRLKEKKVLLVLDDVWHDKYADWDKLLTPLKSGARGSKILVTTRNGSVASVMQTVPTHHLKELTEDSCWFVFIKHAFGDENPNAHPDLQAVGREIVKKCKGLPLAAKTLRRKRDAEEWAKILQSNLWDLPNDDILRALRLSYHYLPSCLKRCFAYCAIFPKDHPFDKDELVHLWMAEGFLIQSGNNEIDVGNEYFHDLASRSFFQQTDSSPTSFVMHDLIHDLATYVSLGFCFILEGDNASKIAISTRYLSLNDYNSPDEAFQTYKRIYAAPHLRTFLPLPGSYFMQSDKKVTHQIFSTLRRLRVLHLPLSYDVVNLPNSIGKLKHLRYLNLSYASLKKLPEVVCTLHNLQTLILKGCYQLTRLPTSMARLINLWYLNIENTNLLKMPPQMGKLIKLQRLTDFFVGKQSGSNIRELGKLNLRGELHIWNLHNILDAQDVAEANLKVKGHLDKLELTWDSEADCSEQAEDILEELEPHTNVRSLCIDGYGGGWFPDWVGDSSFSNVVCLELRRCKYCISLPPLGQLSALKDLVIEDFPEVVTVGSEFYGNCTGMKKPFESLKTLRFGGMSEWREWIFDEGTEIFSHLQELYISDCPNLAEALPNCLPCLTTLEISGCQQLMTPFGRYPTINRFWLNDDFRHLHLEKLPSGLHSLEASGFGSSEFLYKQLEQMGCSPTALLDPRMTGCFSLKCLPFELKTPKVCPDLESFSVCEGIIDDCGDRWYPNWVGDSSFSNIVSLELTSCKYCISLPPLGQLSALKDLIIEDFPEVVTVGSEFYGNCTGMKQSFASLKTLRFRGMPQWREWIFEEGTEIFTLLQELYISDCPNLAKALPNCLPCLTILEIGGCQQLVTPFVRCPIINKFWLSDDSSHLHLEKLLSGLHSLEASGFGSSNFLYKELEQIGCSPTTLGDLRMTGWFSLKCLPLELFPELKTLDILECSDLESFSAQAGILDDLTSLSYLAIQNIPKLVSFPHGGLPAPNLTVLELRKCLNLKWLPDQMHSLLPSLENLTIEYCPEIESFPEGGLPSKLQSLEILSCEKLIPGRLQWDLQSLPCLLTFTIAGGYDIETFPEEMLLPLSLTSLKISNLENLMSLNYEGLQHLTSLRELSIHECSELSSLPEEGLPYSLSTLEISECPLLKKRCKKGKGKDWLKISYIPSIWIDGYPIVDIDY